MERLRQTPSQTVGPFFAYSLTAQQYGYPYDSLVHHALLGPATPANNSTTPWRTYSESWQRCPLRLVNSWYSSTCLGDSSRHTTG